jgi:hypothetical protein
VKLTINEEAVKHYHYGNSGESRRKETADRFGFDFTPNDHMITCKDGKVINIQIGKKYRCTSCNNQRVEIVDIDELFDDGSAMLDVAWRNKRYSVASTQIYESVLREKNVEIDVKHEGILEVPEGKNVNDLPMSHFEKLAKKKGLGKITKALNNLQVWNKNDDPELSKWAGNMIDKLNKKLKKDESIDSRADNYGITIYPPNEQLLSDLQQYLDDNDFMFDDDNLAKSYGYDSAEYELDVQDNFARLYFFGTWDQYVRILEFIRNWIDDTGTDVNVKRGYLDPPMSESLELCESYLDYDWKNTYTTRELKEMSAEKLLDLKWYDADFTKAELVAVTDDYNNATRRPLEKFFLGADNRIHTDKWYPVHTKDGLELFMRRNGRSGSIEVVAGMKKIKYGARKINNVVRAGKVTFDSFWTKDDFFKWILDVNFEQD